MNNGEIIKMIREELGMNQKQFCAYIGEHQGYISSVENGNTKITLDRMIKILNKARACVTISIHTDKSTMLHLTYSHNGALELIK